VQAAGDHLSAWDYFTTALNPEGHKEFSWRELAAVLTQEGNFDFADQAYREAVGEEADDPEILWEWALLKRRLGKVDQGRRLIRKIAEGKWAIEYQELLERARRYLRGR
jgi:hypothetical protein